MATEPPPTLPGRIVAIAGAALRYGGVLLLLLVLAVAVMDALRPSIVIKPIAVAKALGDQGLAAETIAAHLRDDLQDIAAAGSGLGQGPNLAPDSNPLGDITVPGVGLSLATIAEVLRGLPGLDRATEISGDTTSAGARVWLRLRLDDVVVYRTPAPGVAADALEAELQRAAYAVAQRVEPARYAASLHAAATEPGRPHDAGALDASLAAVRAIVREHDAADPAAADAQMLWGLMLDEGGQPDDALMHYQRAAAGLRGSFDTARGARLQDYIGQAELHANRFADALDAFRLAVREAPDHASAASAWLNIGDVYRIGVRQPARAADAYARSLSLAPRLRYARDALGRAQELTGDYHAAAASYIAATEAFPDDRQAYLDLAGLLAAHPKAFVTTEAMRGEIVAARDAYLRLRPDDASPEERAQLAAADGNLAQLWHITVTAIDAPGKPAGDAIATRPTAEASLR